MKKKSTPLEKPRSTVKKAVSLEAFVFLALFLGGFTLLGMKMGLTNMLNTMMNTGYQLLMETVFYIMAIAVLAGAIGSLLTEFGVVALINKILSPLMGVLYGLPGAASVGVVTTYLSDNPAILTLADDPSFRRYFKKYQLPALTNLGTAFGMGLVVSAFMLGTGASGVGMAVLVGNLGAVVGSIVSTRLMILSTRKVYGTEEWCDVPADLEGTDLNHRNVRPGGIGSRFLAAIMEGGASGVKMGLEIIPGVLIICTFVLMLTKGPGAGGVYTGAAYEGVAVLPWIGEKLSFLLKPLFGFTSSACVSVPVTALGAAGAAIGLVPGLLQEGLATAQDVAVFTSMCMCWSGYLSTHVAMMSGLKCSHLTGKAILCHTVGGACAGIFANWAFYLLSML
jgi:hypothetical protein